MMRMRHPAKSPTKLVAPGWMTTLVNDPMILPIAERACRDPKARARNCPGTLSATRVVAAPNIPPIPNPTRNR